MKHHKTALNLAWYLHNHPEAPDLHNTFNYMAWQWGLAMNYEHITIPGELTPTVVREFCQAIINDLSERIAA